MHDSALLNFMLVFGGIIVAGFLGNILFRLTKIPSVLLLMILGAILGPIIGAERVGEIQGYASYFGTVALLIILFEGGLDLDLRTVVQQLGKSIFLTVSVFVLSVVFTMLFAVYVMEMETIQALLLGGIVGGTSPAIILPIVNKLRVGEQFKTIMFLEPALADVLIIVTAIIGVEVYTTQTTDTVAIVGDFVQLIGVAIVLAVVGGAIWARVIGSLRGESVSYMLTLGFLFLLYWLAEIIGASGVIAVFFFGMVLANVEGTLQRVSGGIRRMLGIRVDATKFALDDFVHNITIELSFLVRVFFFVLLGLLLNLDDLTFDRMIQILLITLMCVSARFVGVWIFQKLNRSFTSYENLIMHSMMPRGLATAVVAFFIFDLSISGTEYFPLYALGVIFLTNIIMTGLVAVAERRHSSSLKKERKKTEEEVGGGELSAEERAGIAADATTQDKSTQRQTKESEAGPESPDEEAIPQNDASEIPEPDPNLSAGVHKAVARDVETVTRADARKVAADTPGAEEPDTDEWMEGEHHGTFHDRIVNLLRIKPRRFRDIDYVSTRSLRLTNFVYWLQIFATTMITILGLMMESSEVVLAGMLISPILSMFNSLGMSLTEGDIYMFLKGFVKLLLTAGVIVFLSAIVAASVPFTGVPESILDRMQPTLLDFALAFIVGIFVPIVMLRGRQVEIFALSPIVALLVFPSLAVVGYGLGSGSKADALLPLISGGLLSVIAVCVALFLGAVLVLLTLGVVRHEASDYIREWKKKELTHGVLARILRPLGVTRFLGTAGTPGARVVVLALFCLAVIIPLQRAVNDVSETYAVEETIKELAKRFEVRDRSSITSLDVERGEKAITVRIRVSTKQYFTNYDINEFENEALARLDKSTNLILVQSRGHVGAVSENEDENQSRPTVLETDFMRGLRGLENAYREALVSVTAVEEAEFFGFATRMAPLSGRGITVVSYLADQALPRSSLSLVKSNIATELGVDTSMVQLRWIPRTMRAQRPLLDEMRGPGYYQSAGHLLEEYPELSASIYGPHGINVTEIDNAFDNLRRRHPDLVAHSRLTFYRSDTLVDSYVLVLRLNNRR